MDMCHKYKDLMSLYIDGLLQDGEKQELEQHIEDCPYCAQELKELKQVVERIQSEPQIELPENFHNEFMSKLKREVQRDKTKSRIINYRAYAGAAAGFILTIFCFNLMLSQVSESNQLSHMSNISIIDENSYNAVAMRGVDLGENVFSGQNFRGIAEPMIEAIAFPSGEGILVMKDSGDLTNDMVNEFGIIIQARGSERELLAELLLQSDDESDRIVLQDRINSIDWEIDNYASMIATWNAQIESSEIGLLNNIISYSDERNLLQQLEQTFQNSLNATNQFIGNTITFVIGILPIFLILTLVATFSTKLTKRVKRK